MDMYRAFLAIIISFLILVGYQYFFIKPTPVPPVPPTQEQQTAEHEVRPAPAEVPQQPPAEGPAVQPLSVAPDARDLTVDTPLYTAVFNEHGGVIKSFILKEYRKEKEKDSELLQLVETQKPEELPLLFSPGSGEGMARPLYRADTERLNLSADGGKKSLRMTASLPGGMELVKTMVFDPASYMIAVSYQVENETSSAVTLSPTLTLTNQPFAQVAGSNVATSHFMFSGPVVLVNEELVEVKGKKLIDGPQTLQGDISWAAYEDNYFMCAAVPGEGGSRYVRMTALNGSVQTVIGEEPVVLEPGAQKEFKYDVYFGPKKLSILNEVNYSLAKAINFGWFDIIAKPMLWLLNFFHSIIGNYGVAIILLTILIKGAFWPITQKGMKSMKNMQKLQPKVAKLKEKFKNDPQKMNQEMMALYKTYKVNPLGGCLPMVLQIPFFFALYKVLLMSIELRHAPFMLWINDLSAPDRLWIGFDIPYLHGIPVLTLLMGASMYLQQKMTPTTADPTQARIMQMLPIIFTFMFLNFASGLVLYWFVNNLLSILQQQLINRQSKAKA
ncbi:MAG: membrane protein insertase YidC [Desulfobulbaceae bacterium]|nr:membrane protein insertase YidC [Desulfobulbaceae bacterium]